MALRSITSAHPSRAHLPRCPHRPTGRIRPSATGVWDSPSPSLQVQSDRGLSGTSGRGEPFGQAKEKTRGLLEERVERDAWRGALDALTRLMDAKHAAEAEAQPRES
jgi:hypothetical protein